MTSYDSSSPLVEVTCCVAYIEFGVSSTRHFGSIPLHIELSRKVLVENSSNDKNFLPDFAAVFSTAMSIGGGPSNFLSAAVGVVFSASVKQIADLPH